MTPDLRKQLEVLAHKVAVKNGTPIENLLHAAQTPLRNDTIKTDTSIPTPLPEVQRIKGATLKAEIIRSSLSNLSARTQVIDEAKQLAAVLWDAAPVLNVRRDRLRRLTALHETFLTIALVLKATRGYKHCSQVALHSVGEVIRHQLRLSQGSYYRYMGDLYALGLIDYRGHISGRTVGGVKVASADGTLIAVSLAPGHKARLGPDDYGGHRDLDSDIKAGKTAWNYLRELERSLPASTDWNLKPLMIWALALGNLREPPLEVTLSVPELVLELIMDVPKASRNTCREAVERAAHAICNALGDQHSHRFWCKIQWQLLRRADTLSTEHYFNVLFGIIQRVVIDAKEGFARNPAKLAVSRLMQWDVCQKLNQQNISAVCSER